MAPRVSVIFEHGLCWDVFTIHLTAFAITRHRQPQASWVLHLQGGLTQRAQCQPWVVVQPDYKGKQEEGNGVAGIPLSLPPDPVECEPAVPHHHGQERGLLS